MWLSLCVPAPMPPWNPFLWCFPEGLCLHTSSCFGVSDAIKSLHVVCIPPQTWGAPCSSSSLRWHGPMVETVIQLSSSLCMETQAGRLLPCVLHHNHVPCALWPAWLPTEFLEAAWLGQKSSASWAQLSLGEPRPEPCACAIHYGGRFGGSVRLSHKQYHTDISVSLCTGQSAYRDSQRPHEGDVLQGGKAELEGLP